MVEFVSLANKQSTTNVNELNTNPVGGCNLRQRQCANTDRSDGTTVIRQCINKLKAKLNIGAIVAHKCSIPPLTTIQNNLNALLIQEQLMNLTPMQKLVLQAITYSQFPSLLVLLIFIVFSKSEPNQGRSYCFSSNCI